MAASVFRPTFPPGIGELAAYRHSRGVTQAEMARALGLMSSHNIPSYERGRLKITPAWFARALAAIDAAAAERAVKP